jgi:type I restriction enzyme R subunit
MCADLFQLLCENGGPEQKVIIFCTREIHADRVAQHMNNLYVRWCRERGETPKDLYAFKCMGGANNGADLIESMRGSAERAFIACTVDLLEAGVDIERLNAVVFFRYLQSPIKFYQMVGRGTRIHEETAEVQVLAVRLHRRHGPVRHRLHNQAAAAAQWWWRTRGRRRT